MIQNKEVELNWQEIQLLQTLLKPIAEDNDSSNYTRTVAVNILLKLDKKL